MGYVRLGRLPMTYRWQQVMDLLTTVPADLPGISAAVLRAAENRLRELAADPSLTYSFWLLTRIARASYGDDFTTRLAELGVPVSADTSVIAFISQVTDHVGAEHLRDPSSGHFAELSSLAMRRAFMETAGQQGRSLFGSDVEDLQDAFRAYSTRDQFAQLSRIFFADFLSRTIRSLVDRELSKYVGPSHEIANVQQSAAFMEALDLHTRQASRIVEDFSSGWYSKHNWESRGEITQEEAQGFVAVALRKLRQELKLGATVV
jgi:hypothetical protein